jgi:hypothetical protein
MTIISLTWVNSFIFVVTCASTTNTPKAAAAAATAQTDKKTNY